MVYLRRLVLMLQFMTAIPIRIGVKAEKEDFGRGLAIAPVVGLILGLLLAAANYLLSFAFSPLIAAVLTFAFYIYLTGGLHLDGLGDTADGLFSNRPRERMLEIMKDSRVGTNAVLVLILVLLMNVSLLSSMKGQVLFALIMMPVAGRLGSVIGAGSSSYAGTSDGPGRWCVEHCRWKDILAGLILYFAVFLSAARVTGLLGGSGHIHPAFIFAAALIPPLSAFFLTRVLGKRLGGVTGDILGAVCELNQTVFLITIYFLSVPV